MTPARIPLLLISTADTDLLAAAPRRRLAAGEPGPYDARRPARAARRGRAWSVVRLLGGRRAWPEGLDAVLAAGVPVVVLGGEAAPDAELMALSTVPAGRVTEALGVPARGRPGEPGEAGRFLSDTVLLTGEGFEPPADAAGVRGAARTLADGPGGRWSGSSSTGRTSRGQHRVRRHPGDAVDAAGATPLPVFCGSLRGLDRTDNRAVRPAAALRRAGRHGARGRWRGARDGERGRRRRLGRRGAGRAGRAGRCRGSASPDPRAVAAERRRAAPMDAAMQVAIPEFDGRLITVPFSFKEDGPDGVRSTSPTRAGRAGGRDRGRARPAAARAAGREAARDGAVVVPDQARPGRQRGRPGHPGVGGRAAAGAGAGGLRPGRDRPGRRTATR